MYTIPYLVGEIAKPPALPPRTVWRRRIAPTPDFATETKTSLDDGDEFVATRSDGGAIKLTVGAVIQPGGNP